MSDDRTVVTVRLNATQHELLRRRSISDGVTFQQVLAAGVNAYVLGDLRVTPTGRYHVAGPEQPLSREDEVTVRAPTPDQPERTVTLRQPPAEPGRKGTTWLRDHLHRRTGKHISTRLLRRLLAHMEEEGTVEPRDGRYWKFTGADDPTVVAVAIAYDDGTLDDLVRTDLENL